MFVPTQALSALALALLATPSLSHMIMASPKPFGSPNNSPLDPSGSDFPCKATSSDGGPSNEWTVGSTQKLSFTGSAVHGGGSCQIAVTTDKNPTKDSAFKVIHSIEGGCPGVSGPNEFDFKVPDALPDGDLVMAWTWFNKIGNREMYMNCANIKVSGGSSDKSKFEKLPDMAVANIGVGKGATCKTAESSDYSFEGVGKNGDTVDRVGSGPFVDLCGGQASAGTGSGSTDSGNAGTGSGSEAGAGAGSGSGAANNGQYTPGPNEGGAAATPAASAPAASAPAASAPASSAPAASAPAVSSAPAAAPSDAVTSTLRTLLTVTAPSAPAASAPAASAPAASAPAAAPSGGATGGSSCSTNGAIVCNGDSQFGLCNNGNVVWQEVAAGTKCQDGKIAKRDFTHRAQRTAIY